MTRDWRRAVIEQTFTFPWTTPPLSANHRTHWAVKARTTRDVRSLAAWTCRKFPQVDRVEVALVWVVADKRRRDGADNIVPTLKAICDGLVDVEIVPDDTKEFMVKVMPDIRYEQGGTPRFELTLKEIG